MCNFSARILLVEPAANSLSLLPLLNPILSEFPGEPLAQPVIQQVASLEAAAIALEQAPYDICLIDGCLVQQDNFLLLPESLLSQSTALILVSASEQVCPLSGLSLLGVDCLSRSALSPAVLAQAILRAVERSQLLSSLSQTEREKQQLALAFAELQQREQRYELALQGSTDGIWDWDLGSGSLFFSPQWKATLGYGEAEIGTQPEEWFERIHPEDLYWVKRDLTAHLDGISSRFESEHRILHQDGEYRWVLSRAQVSRNALGEAVRLVGIQTDVSGLKHVEAKIVHDAHYDLLTGLPNRVLLMERLCHAGEMSSRRSDYIFAVLFIDLDRFKMINDSLGHAIGDQLLCEISTRLADCLRPHDTVARLGGDEFVILLEDVKSQDNVMLVAERIMQALAAPFNLEGREIFTSASIGITFSSSGFNRPEDLLRDADLAMYGAKTKGRGRYAVFHPKMHSSAVALLEMENDLRRAVERDELQLYYQPIISLRSNQLVGFEALIRWQHPQQGLISPARFVPIAEETGLIIPIGSWILRQACLQMRQWQQQFPDWPGLTVNVNLSSKQFSPHLAEQVEQILSETGLEPHYLKLEITESVLMSHAESAIATLSQLKQLGIQLAIDDFGTGYSSLSYLHRLPIDTLKVDRSFIQRVDSDGEQLAIVRTIITLAWNLGMEVVAEGVETLKQLAQLRSLRCEYAQGYLFSQPLAVESIGALLNQAPDHSQFKSVGKQRSSAR
ncbi:MAG: EAL domain-containing protein [Pegethrix bostrychoides GSE-TBD4-15B]|jgi:diguanylate cyclase (GGDEF)-like protein/PAS domain S-box-containing protein|uniref:EAL domain-containing protein n=1 Tax=Pegethrix bostrychoides GSE-TBD4-15B TaxID=2839662 RepID=A0A951PDN1_9CYAN|nr:EAL domain-containing protein [Pegethrix bostrychoides GSE-TBD4-15B]